MLDEDAKRRRREEAEARKRRDAADEKERAAAKKAERKAAFDTIGPLTIASAVLGVAGMAIWLFLTGGGGPMPNVRPPRV